MITADTLKTLTTFNCHGLAMALHHSGYTGASFETAKFLGITNGGQFCYSVVFKAPSFEGTDSTKVYLSYDNAAGKVSAGY